MTYKKLELNQYGRITPFNTLIRVLTRLRDCDALFLCRRQPHISSATSLLIEIRMIQNARAHLRIHELVLQSSSAKGSKLIKIWFTSSCLVECSNFRSCIIGYAYNHSERTAAINIHRYSIYEKRVILNNSYRSIAQDLALTCRCFQIITAYPALCIRIHIYIYPFNAR